MEFSTSRDWKWLHGLLKQAFVLRFRLYYGHITRVPWSWFYLKVDNSTENLREGKWKSTTVSKCIKNESCIGWVHIFTAMCVHLSSVINRIVFYMQCWPLSLHDRICRHCPIFLNFKTLETLWCRLDVSFVKNNSWQSSVLTLSLTNSEQGLYSLKKIILCVWVFYSYRYILQHTHALCLQVPEENTKCPRIWVMNSSCHNVGTENWIWILCRSNKYSRWWVISPAHH